MSQANVEIVRRAFDAFVRFERAPPEAALDMIHPDVKIRMRIGEVYEAADELTYAMTRCVQRFLPDLGRCSSELCRRDHQRAD
jgi:hypothetical protein